MCFLLFYFLAVFFLSRLICALLLKLSCLHKQAYSKPEAKTDMPTTTLSPTLTPTPTKPISRTASPSPKISLPTANNMESEHQKKSKTPETEWDYQKKRHAYLSWAMVKTVAQVNSRQQRFKRLISEAHHENVTRLLDNYSLQILPNFAAFELCPSGYIDSSTNSGGDNIVQVLENTQTVLPIAKLLPKNQEVQGAMNITWIKVLNFYYQLVQRCQWHKKSLEVSWSDWNLHYHAATPTLYLKVQAMHAFLSTQFLAFKECQSPPFPRFNLQQQTGHLYRLISLNPSNLEQHLTAGECELTLIWHSMCHAPILTSGPEDQLTGYFAFNHRPLQIPLQAAYYSTGINVFHVDTTTAKLAKLQQEWVMLIEDCHDYRHVNEKSMYRSVASHSSKAQKNLQMSAKLIKQLNESVRSLATVFGVNKKEVRGHF